MFRILTSEAVNHASSYHLVCSLKLQPNHFYFNRSPALTSFSAFGVEFESSNRLLVMQMFAKQLHHSFTSFVNNPLIEEYLQGKRVIAKLRHLLHEQINKKRPWNQPNVSKLFKNDSHDELEHTGLIPIISKHKKLEQKREEGLNEDTISRGLTDEFNSSGEARERYNKLCESEEETQKGSKKKGSKGQ